MNDGRKNQKKPLLFVKEVIIPHKKEPETGESHIQKNSGTEFNHLKNEKQECVESSEKKFVKIGDHEVGPIENLLILEKKPLENYFEGTVRKKPNKRKNKHQRATKNIRGLDFIELLINPNGQVPVPVNRLLKRREPVKDENNEGKKLMLKISKFEKLRERRSYFMQKHAEESYIQEMENLAETWWEIMKKRKQLKQCKHVNSNDALTFQKPCCKKNSKNYNRFCFSALSRRFWNDNQVDSKSSKKQLDDEERIEKKTDLTLYQPSLDNLEETFLEKLVFIDDDDDDDDGGGGLDDHDDEDIDD